MRLHTSGSTFGATAPLYFPTQSGVLSLSKGEICWSLSVTTQAWDREMLAYTQRAPSQVLPVLPQAPVRWTSPPQSLTQSHPVSNFAWILILLILRFHPIADFA